MISSPFSGRVSEMKSRSEGRQGKMCQSNKSRSEGRQGKMCQGNKSRSEWRQGQMCQGNKKCSKGFTVQTTAYQGIVETRRRNNVNGAHNEYNVKVMVALTVRKMRLELVQLSVLNIIEAVDKETPISSFKVI